jgi:hypothetical protein
LCHENKAVFISLNIGGINLLARRPLDTRAVLSFPNAYRLKYGLILVTQFRLGVDGSLQWPKFIACSASPFQFDHGFFGIFSYWLSRALFISEKPILIICKRRAILKNIFSAA